MTMMEEQQQHAAVGLTDNSGMPYSSHPLHGVEEDGGLNVLNLLQISQFLTAYQSFYASHPVGPILLEDLQQVVHYRALKRELKHWEEQASIYSNFNDQGEWSLEDSGNPFQSKIDELHEKLGVYQPNAAAAVSDKQQQQYDKHDRIVKIDKLWRRMQVWTCKALAQHVLVADIPKAPRDLQTQLWSYPLSLPLAAYAMRVLPPVKGVKKDNDKLLPFAKIFDDTYNAHSNMPNGLLVPPNHYNCREYTRLCNMMAQLPNDQARQTVHLSPLTLNARSVQYVCQVKFKWHPTDLVALWIRAQRSPQALRHLVQLFRVTPLKSDGNNNKECTEQNQFAGHHYRIEFQGNHKLVYKRSILCSKLADKISTWAMVNQVLCTYPQFVKHWREQVSEQRQQWAERNKFQLRKRKRRVCDGDKSNKRRRQHSNQPPLHQSSALQEGAQIELWRDCETFLLRTWARRHARDLKLLYQHPWQVQQEQEQQQQQPTLVSTETLRAHFKSNLKGTSDYNLLRIERRIGLGKYGSNKTITVEHAVTSLVRDFCDCLLNENKRRGENGDNDELNAMVDRLQKAKDEFATAYRDFQSVWNEAGAIAAARSLLEWTDEAATYSISLTNAASTRAVAPAGSMERVLLSSAPAPWLNICSNCNAAVKDEGSYRTCTCCEQVYHNQCCGQGNAKQNGLDSCTTISAFPPLRELFLVRVPSSKKYSNFYLPNYCGDRASEISWSTKRVTLTRVHDAPWGLKFFDSRLCAKHMDDVCRGDLPLWTWNEAKGPMLRIPHVGVIVSSIVDDSPSARSPLQVDDVIVAVRVGASEDTTAAGDEKFHPAQMHTLAHYKGEECMEIFQQRSKILELVIERPNRSIVKEAEACVKHLEQSMEIPQTVLDKIKLESLYFCPSCRCDTAMMRTARDNIRNCKAVIRRLGSEWYGPSFWYEDHVRAEHILSLDSDEEEGSPANDKGGRSELHSKCVSLGRLDRMMDELLDRQDEDRVVDQNESMAFCVGKQRLDWAPPILEQSPMALLCRGMNLMLHDYQRSPTYHVESGQPPTMKMRKALAADFVRLFSCWCLMRPAENQTSLKGPYPHAFLANNPVATSRCCASCQIRRLPLDVDGSLCAVCQSTCTRGSEHVPLPRIDVTIQRYLERARLVGSSILLLPGDPVLEEETKALLRVNLELELCGRAFEFLVASYLPSSLKDCGEKEDSGVFYLLPVVNQTQMQYLLARCKFRQPNQDGLNEETIESWRKDGLLNLDGVLQLSFKELVAKVNATRQIIDAVSNEVARQARCTCEKAMIEVERWLEETPQHENDEEDDEKVVPCTDPRCCASSLPDMNHSFDASVFDTTSTSVLIEAGFQTRSPVMVEMVDSKLPTIPENVGPAGKEIESTAPHSKLIPEDRTLSMLPKELMNKSFFSHPLGVSKGLENTFLVFYSDLYFDSEVEKRHFETSKSAALENQCSQCTARMTVVLSADAETTEATRDWAFGNVRGWGFELIYWKTQRVIRVGRVHHGGPAFASGLRSGDQLVSINGTEITKLGSFLNLPCAILSVPFTMSSKHESLVRTLLHWISTEKRPLGPVILEVLRASPRHYDAKNTLTQHQENVRQFTLRAPEGRRQPNPQEQVVVSPKTIPTAQNRPQAQQRTPVYHDVDERNSSSITYGNNRDWSRTQRSEAELQQCEPPTHQPVFNQATMVPPPIPPPGQYQNEPGLSWPHPPTHEVKNWRRFPPTHGPVAPRPTPGGGGNTGVAPPMQQQQQQHRLFRAVDFPWLAETFRDLKMYMAAEGTNYTQNTYLSADDLHMPFSGGFLTVAESSVLMTAVAKDQPMLGLRLLSPRYPVKLIFRNLELFGGVNFGAFRRLPPLFWSNLLTADYNRSQKEDSNAPIVFVDPNFNYHMPTKAFPIDQFFREFLGRGVPAAAQFPAPAPPVQALPGPSLEAPTWRTAEEIDLTGDDEAADAVDALSNNPERIRGGGWSETGVAPKHLIDLPQSEWNNTLVKGRCATERGEENSSFTRFIGRVTFESGSCPTDEKVDVCVIYLKSMGPILRSDRFYLKYHPRKLKLVDDTSKDAVKALSAERPASNSEANSMTSIDPLQETEAQKVSQDPELLKLPDTRHRTEEKEVEPEHEESQLKPTAATKIAFVDVTMPGLEEWHLPESNTVIAAMQTNHDQVHLQAAAEATRGGESLQAKNLHRKHTKDLVEKLCEFQKISTSPLGFLPDGRPLYWFRSDPDALFLPPLISMIQDDPISELALVHATNEYGKCVQSNFGQQRVSRYALQPSQSYSCFWGCSITSPSGPDECLSFESIAKLREHLRLHHSYVPRDPPLVSHPSAGTRLVRVDDISAITRICSGLASAACARSPALKEYTKSFVFCGDRLFSNVTRQQVMQSMTNPYEFVDASMMSLSIRLACLFKIGKDEKHGGLSKGEMLDILCHGQDERQRDPSSTEPGCCSLGCERVLMTDNDEYRGTGCLPIGDICFEDVETYPKDCGDISIGDAKWTLLALASNIPESIRKMESNGQVAMNRGTTCLHSVSPQMQLWGDRGFESWRLFVVGSQDVCALVQAFVVLLFSIDAELPEWWEAEGLGWSALRACTSLSSLLYHLQVFEAALTEYISDATMPFKDMSNHIPADLAPFPYDKQVSVTLERAKEIGLSRFKGDYNYFCSICEDGGDVMCCELCKNVGHAACYKLTTSNVNDFVCYACMTDVADVYSEDAVAEDLDL